MLTARFSDTDWQKRSGEDGVYSSRKGVGGEDSCCGEEAGVIGEESWVPRSTAIREEAFRVSGKRGVLS